MSQFSSNEAVSLEKDVDCSNEIRTTPVQDIEAVYEIDKCVTWIKENNYQRVCLQFPDYLLPDSAHVAFKFKEKLQQNVYIMADTAYGSCCVDYVAASHINADCIIHYGPVCFSSSTTSTPFMNVYDKANLDFDKFYETISEKFTVTSDNSHQSFIILLDTCYIHVIDKISQKLAQIKINQIDRPDLNLTDQTVVFLGDETSRRKLTHLKFTYKPRSLFFWHGINSTLQEYESDTRILKRRYFLIEKIKDSKTVGIVIGTLAVKNYLKVIDRLKNLIKQHKKKYYLISVGKPTVAKLANFPEIDIYVAVTCALNEIYDSREFFKPIVTPFDVELALNPASSGLEFSLDFNTFVSNPISEEISGNDGDVSLISGKIRANCDETESAKQESGQEVALKSEGTITLSSDYGAGFLASRSWKGLEQNIGMSEVKLAEEGRKGIAQKYEGEME